MNKKESLKVLKEKVKTLKTKVMPIAVGASIALSSAAVVGCSSDPNKPKQTKTAIVVNADNTAMLIEVAYFYSETVSKSADKVEYTFHLHHGAYNNSAYVQVYDDEKTDVIIIDDFDSFEKAKAMAYTLVGKDGTIYLYGDEGIIDITVDDTNTSTEVKEKIK